MSLLPLAVFPSPCEQTFVIINSEEEPNACANRDDVRADLAEFLNELGNERSCVAVDIVVNVVVMVAVVAATVVTVVVRVMMVTVVMVAVGVVRVMVVRVMVAVVAVTVVAVGLT